MDEIRHRTIPANGIDMHVAECGEGPLVLMCHGWPELWYSWRHQLRALAQAGFRAVAPDMRGFGETSAPHDVAAYTIFHNVGDMIALVSALAATFALIVGHDWGAPVARRGADAADIFRRRGPERATPPARFTMPLETLKQAASPTTTGSI
jgi:pimeloyl-ACP methyl ester carboxylesterase